MWLYWCFWSHGVKPPINYGNKLYHNLWTERPCLTSAQPETALTMPPDEENMSEFSTGSVSMRVRGHQASAVTVHRGRCFCAVEVGDPSLPSLASALARISGIWRPRMMTAAAAAGHRDCSSWRRSKEQDSSGTWDAGGMLKPTSLSGDRAPCFQTSLTLGTLVMNDTLSTKNLYRRVTIQIGCKFWLKTRGYELSDTGNLVLVSSNCVFQWRICIITIKLFKTCHRHQKRLALANV